MAYFFGLEREHLTATRSILAREIVTIPARRPIKPVYIRKLVCYIEAHGDVS